MIKLDTLDNLLDNTPLSKVFTNIDNDISEMLYIINEKSSNLKKDRVNNELMLVS